MKTYRRRVCLSLLVFVFAVSAQAAVTEYLPSSSHHQGWAYDEQFDVRIDFAVYDTLDHPGEFTLDVPGLSPGRYIYAYQIFNESDDEDFSVDLFSLAGIGAGAITSADAIGSIDDQTDGVATLAEAFDPSLTQAYWRFDEDTLTTGLHSWLLVLSSDSDWVAGSYEINPTPGNDVPLPNIPEPATMLLLGLGSVVFVRRR